jgi:hypothetical protein
MLPTTGASGSGGASHRDEAAIGDAAYPQFALFYLFHLFPPYSCSYSSVESRKIKASCRRTLHLLLLME